MKYYPSVKKSYVLLYAVLGFIVIVSNAFINPANHIISFAILVIAAAVSYFYITIEITEKNWLDVRAIFSLVWLFTIGLASLRLLGYQEEWQSKTWLLLGLAYSLFPFGFELGIMIGRILYNKGKKKDISILGNLTIRLQSNRLFMICVVTTLIGIITFVIGIAINGFIPFFSDDSGAYVKFYTRFYVFTVASTVISPLCYYTIKTQPTTKVQKIILYGCIVYTTFIFPILAVARGVFLTSALLLMTSVYYLNNKRFLILVVSIIIMGLVYGYASTLRNISDTQLEEIFEISELEINHHPTIESVDLDSNSLKLPPKLAFLYGYLTVSHDNFNEAVQNSKQPSLGIRQFRPFNVVFRLKLPTIEKTYLVKDHLNTYNFIGDAYYDFHEFGMLLVFIWAMIFGSIQEFYLLGNGPFALLALGNVVSPVTLSFFAPWMSNFTHWLYWGTVFLLFIACCLDSLSKVDRENDKVSLC